MLQMFLVSVPNFSDDCSILKRVAHLSLIKLQGETITECGLVNMWNKHNLPLK